CGPILFADAEAGIIGAAHAGWRGALTGVIDATVAVMEELGARRERIAAALGPTISAASYEVGDELRRRFEADDAANQRFLSAAGGMPCSTFPAIWRSALTARGSARRPVAACAPVSIRCGSFPIAG